MIRPTNAHLHSRVGGRRTLNGQLILSETHLKSANEEDSLALFLFSVTVSEGQLFFLRF
jgi:hypothetical protein